MKPKVFFRTASVLLVLFALLHTIGFRQTDPRWGVETLVASMQTIHFNLQGFTRSYWDIYTGFGLFVSLFLLLAAAMAWQFGALPREVLARLMGMLWSFLVSFLLLTLLSLKYFFTGPLVFSVLITICLSIATWLSVRNV